MNENPTPNRSAGGHARAEKLTPEQRKESAQRAAIARWNDNLPKVICGAPDRPLCIGDIEIPCYILEGEKRVLVQRAIVSAMGMARGSSSKGGGDRLSHFVNQQRLTSFISSELKQVTENPIKFIAPNGSIAHGYEAEYLAKLCFAVMDAEREGKIQDQQTHIAKRCRILIEGFSIVGINALVDEATGYQEVRDRKALQQILRHYIDGKLYEWALTFPTEFFKGICKLKNWPWNNGKMPSVTGRYINDLVYHWLAPFVLEELKRLNPPTEKGHRKYHHHRFLTRDIGHPSLARMVYEHIGIQSALEPGEWEKYKRLVDRKFPKLNTTMALPLPEH